MKEFNVYDNQHFFDEYQKMRSEKINSNVLVEIPQIKKLLPDLKDKTILDLGCGAGGMSRYFIKQGAKRVLAIDISKNMITEAKKHDSNKIEYRVLSMDKLNSIDEKFDLVFSSLAFHYVKNFEKLMQNISRLLNKDGLLIYSQEHPMLTATIPNDKFPKYYEVDKKRYYILADYQRQTKRVGDWLDLKVTKYHRTVENIVNTIINSGLEILELEPSKPSKRALELLPKLSKEFERPMYLFVKARKK